MTRQAGLQSESRAKHAKDLRYEWDYYLLVKGTGSPIAGKGTQNGNYYHLWIIPICSIDRKSSLGWELALFRSRVSKRTPIGRLSNLPDGFLSFVLWQYLQVKRTAVDKLLIPGLVLGQGIGTFSQWEGITEAAMDGTELTGKSQSNCRDNPTMERCYSLIKAVTLHRFSLTLTQETPFHTFHQSQSSSKGKGLGQKDLAKESK